MFTFSLIMASNTQYSPQQCAVGDLCSEQRRLNTFQSWPLSAAVPPSALAKAGFYYLGQTDRVRCAFCSGTLKNWQHGDDAFTEHRKHFAHCPFIQGHDAGNIPLEENRGSTAVQPSAANEPDPEEVKERDVLPEVVTAAVLLHPRHPEYQSVASRQETFVEWPPDAVQRPEALVEAGFFYFGHSDGVRCFCCDGTLHNWEPGDDPWVEHARWFPRCPYLIQQKGLGFVSTIQSQQAAQNAAAEQQRVSPHQSPVASRREIPFEDPLMSSEVVRQVLDMGFDHDLVHTVLQQRLSSSGDEFPTVDELVNTLLGNNSPTPQGSGERTASPVAGLPRSESLPPLSPPAQRQDESTEDRILCKICMDREVAVTFLPCGHLVCCSECAKHVQQCPVCRQRVRASIRTYLC